MGEARRSAQAKKSLGETDRAIALGTGNFFEAAYDLLYGMVEHVYTRSGGINHQLIGLDFADGKPLGMHVLLVKRIQDVPRLRDEMLGSFPMVAHIVEAWGAPDASVAPSLHPQRYDVVSIMLHTIDMAAHAECRVNEKMRTMTRATLMYPDQVLGRLGRELPTRH